MDTSYNPAYLNIISEESKDVTLEDTVDEKSFIHQ